MILKGFSNLSDPKKFEVGRTGQQISSMSEKPSLGRWCVQELVQLGAAVPETTHNIFIFPLFIFRYILTALVRLMIR